MHPALITAAVAERRRDQLTQVAAARRAREARRARRGCEEPASYRSATGCQSGWLPVVRRVPTGDATLNAR
jgi:hypothetical protein